MCLLLARKLYINFMKSSAFLLSISLIVLFSACAIQQNRLQSKKGEGLPNATPISASLYCDKTEVTNFNWLEYLYWLDRCFGEDSEEYKNALPKDVWHDVKCLTNRDENEYFRDPMYQNYPVVGITQEQANAFSQWRSDRVFEFLLIKNGVLDFDVTQNADRYFTIAKYFKGEYLTPVSQTDSTNFRLVAPDTSLLYPYYRLPTLDERIMVLDYVDSTEYSYHLRFPKKEAKAAETIPLFQMAIKVCDSSALEPIGSQWKMHKEPTRYVDEGIYDDKRIAILYNVRGNVAEWSSEPNITFGGGWPHNIHYTLKNDTLSADAANAWTGFRCVAEWKKYTP
jgi:hypothetical protein